MNTNTRRSFIQTAVAAIAAFFGIKPKSDGFESRDFKKADPKSGIAEFHLGIEPNGTGYRVVLSTRLPDGSYEHTAIATGKDIHNPGHVNRLVVLQAIMAAIDGKYSAMMAADSPRVEHAENGTFKPTTNIPFVVACDKFGRTVITVEGMSEEPNQRWEKKDGALVKVFCPDNGPRMPRNGSYKLGDPDFLVFPKA